MRLLHTKTLELAGFFDTNIPPYAILSHRWENEEVSFQDLTGDKGPEMAGFKKIQGCCTQAMKDGWDYVWIDSCCIDKSSSAELSEAINSMFAWYSRAKVCYAYLSDVHHGPRDKTVLEFQESQWFTRGWTLQELLAPACVEFFNADWVEIGTKSSLQIVIASITGINDMFKFKEASVAQEMSWAAIRVTTRIEDQAYSLMGLFEINMPPLYGEGNNAFIRLQLEILAKHDDQSIFAWDFSLPSLGGGLLAHSPKCFRYSGKCRRAIIEPERTPPAMTSKGLRMEVTLFKKDDVSMARTLRDGVPPDRLFNRAAIALAPTNCTFQDTDEFVLLPLSFGAKGWSRDSCPVVHIPSLTLKMAFKQGRAEKKVIYVKEAPENRVTSGIMPRVASRVLLKTSSLSQDHVFVTQQYYHDVPGSLGFSFWEKQNNGDILIISLSFFSAALLLASKSFDPLAIVVGLSSGNPFWISVRPISDWEILQDVAKEMAQKLKDRVGPDRASCELSDGRTMLVSIKNASVAEEALYIVDLTLCPVSEVFRID